MSCDAREANDNAISTARASPAIVDRAMIRVCNRSLVWTLTVAIAAGATAIVEVVNRARASSRE
jgi:hypothetical protein